MGAAGAATAGVVAAGFASAGAGAEAEEEPLGPRQGPLMVPLEGVGEAWDDGAAEAEAADPHDGPLQEAADVEDAALSSSAWLAEGPNRVHKSTLVRELFARKGTSNDRTRRVMSMYGTGGQTQAAEGRLGEDSEEEVLCTGDPVALAVSVGGRWALAVAQVGKFVAPQEGAPFSLPHSIALSQRTTLHLDVLQLAALPGDAAWQWDGKCAGRVVVQGALVLPLNPTLAPRTVPVAASTQQGIPTHQFLKSELEQLWQNVKLCAAAHTPPHVSAVPTGAAFPYTGADGQHMFCNDVLAGGGQDDWPCLVCKEKHKRDVLIKCSEMRAHVGAHMLHGDTPHSLCGFCGTAACVPALVKGSSAQPQAAVDRCTYGHQFKLAYCMKGDGGRCNNAPMECCECKHVFWKYGMDAHWRTAHPSLAMPADFAAKVEIGEKERSFLLASLKKALR